jgi:hypothetical protein
MILDIGIALGVGIVIAVIIGVVLRRRRQRKLELDTRTGQYEEEELTEEEAATLERMKKMRNLDPGQRYEDYPLEEGARYDTWSGAIIYKDSEVIKPYIGSEEEERDAERARIPQPPKSKEGEWPFSGCETCLGHGRLNFGTGSKCPDCKGSGSRPARNP